MWDGSDGAPSTGIVPVPAPCTNAAPFTTHHAPFRTRYSPSRSWPRIVSRWPSNGITAHVVLCEPASCSRGCIIPPSTHSVSVNSDSELSLSGSPVSYYLGILACSMRHLVPNLWVLQASFGHPFQDPRAFSGRVLCAFAHLAQQP